MTNGKWKMENMFLFHFGVFWDRISSSGSLGVEMFRARGPAYWLLILILASSSAALAQDQQQRDQDDPIRLKTDLVTVTASVNGASARAIKSLKADDFTIYEDGVKQNIAHFAATEEPFTLLLLLDISGSTRD